MLTFSPKTQYFPIYFLVNLLTNLLFVFYSHLKFSMYDRKAVFPQIML